MNTFARSLLGLLLTATTAVSLAATVYTYDELNRLTKVVYDDGRGISYTYDAAGNLTSTQNITATVAPSFSLDLTAAAVTTAGGSSIGSFTYLPPAASGRNRPAAQFTAGYIRIPNSPSIQFSTGATLDLWVRIDSNTGMTGYGNYATSAWAMTLLAKSHDRTGVGFVTNSPDPAATGTGYGWVGAATYDRTWACNVVQPYTPSNANAALGQWFRVTFVISPTTGMRHYVDKQLVYECPNLRPSFAGMNARDLYIGRYDDNFWYPLNGAISDIRIYKQALTPAEVAGLP